MPARITVTLFVISGATVIITGESGVGKEVVARAIHHLSDRSAKPYVAFNCASVPRELFEGQLFGYISPAPSTGRRLLLRLVRGQLRAWSARAFGHSGRAAFSVCCC